MKPELSLLAVNVVTVLGGGGISVRLSCLRKPFKLAVLRGDPAELRASGWSMSCHDKGEHSQDRSALEWDTR
jgi:hypothetical protein